MNLTILVSGSRGWKSPAPIEVLFGLLDRLRQTEMGTFISIRLIHGNDSRADRMAGSIAAVLGWDVIEVDADWARYGKESAGPIRNQKMLDEYKPDYLIAFHLVPITPGTADMISRAHKAGVKVLRIPAL